MKIKYGIPEYILASVTKNLKLLKYLNSCSCTKQFVESLVTTCKDRMVNTTINISSAKNLYCCYNYHLFSLYIKFYISYI